MNVRRAHQWQLALAIVATAWSFAIISSPILAGRTGSAGPMLVVFRAVGAFICHQRPDRSFQSAGVVWPVCARCTGIYAGAAVGALATFLFGARQPWWSLVRRARVSLALAAVPTAATLMLEVMCGVATSNAVRAISGLPLGAALAWAIITATGSDPSVEVH